MKAKTIFWQDPASIAAVAGALRSGNIVVGSSDTVLGLLADTSQSGFLALNDIKKRTEKPYLILIASPDQVSHFVDTVPAVAAKLIKSCWPGPLTIILKAKKTLPEYVQSVDGTVALRVPLHQGLLILLKQFDGLFSTSANLTGKPVPESIEHLDPKILNSCAYCITDIDKDAQMLPSTIIDCTENEMKVVREGAYSLAELQKIVGVY